ncbi:hypothetical protein ZWY2020_020782 [Hordeum vulgare]|nr:hypothetical protein ZWY2020_020782 [Hordeum vulgare]
MLTCTTCAHCPGLRVRLIRRRRHAARARRAPDEDSAGSRVTALLAYLSSRRVDCLLFAGHADGSIAAHQLTESSPHDDDWLTLAAASSRLLICALNDTLALVRSTTPPSAPPRRSPSSSNASSSSPRPTPRPSTFAP